MKGKALSCFNMSFMPLSAIFFEEINLKCPGQKINNAMYNFSYIESVNNVVILQVYIIINL